MAKTRWLQAACAVTMLAAVPAFAQSNNPIGQTGANGSGSPQVSPGGTTPQGSNSYGTMAQDNANAGSGAQAQTGSQYGTQPRMHHSASNAHSRHMMHSSRTDASQNASVDQLNDQSLQAARQGQAFNGPTGAGMSGGSMSDMPGGSMSGGATSGGSMPSGGASSGNR